MKLMLVSRRVGDGVLFVTVWTAKRHAWDKDLGAFHFLHHSRSRHFTLRMSSLYHNHRIRAFHIRPRRTHPADSLSLLQRPCRRHRDLRVRKVLRLGRGNRVGRRVLIPSMLVLLRLGIQHNRLGQGLLDRVIGGGGKLRKCPARHASRHPERRWDLHVRELSHDLDCAEEQGGEREDEAH